MAFSFIGGILLALSIIVGIGSRHWLKTDNFIEEGAEKIIYIKTGCDVDLPHVALSPDTDKDEFNFFHKIDVVEEGKL